MSDRDLKLNSLSRYTKDSPRFILEAHNHCEVPAGCGGVVLRWWNPAQGTPVEIWLYTAGENEFSLDGKPAATGRPIVSPGPHAIALRISATDTEHGVLLFAAIYDEESGRPSLSRKTGRNLTLLSTGGEGWKYSLRDPGDEAWLLPGFDDSGWRAMVEKEVPKPERWNYQYNRLIDRKARGLGVPDASASSIWVRKEFAL